jgi:hypothetical protein
MHLLRICCLPMRISLIALAHLAAAFVRGAFVTRIESIFQNLIQLPSTTPRDPTWVNALLVVCVQA